MRRVCSGAAAQHNDDHQQKMMPMTVSPPGEIWSYGRVHVGRGK